MCANTTVGLYITVVRKANALKFMAISGWVKGWLDISCVDEKNAAAGVSVPGKDGFLWWLQESQR